MFKKLPFLEYNIIMCVKRERKTTTASDYKMCSTVKTHFQRLPQGIDHCYMLNECAQSEAYLMQFDLC